MIHHAAHFMTPFRLIPARTFLALGTVSALTAATTLGLGLSPFMSTHLPRADALAFPTDPTDQSVSSQWVNSSLRSADVEAQDALNVESFSPSHPVVGEDITITVSLDGTHLPGLSAETPITLDFYRAESTVDTNHARKILTVDSSAYPYHLSSITLTAPIAVSIPLTIPAEQLSITQPGTYPIMINASTEYGYATSERFLLSVGMPSSAAGSTSTTVSDDALQGVDTRTTSTPTSTLIYPITEKADIVPGETGEAPDREDLYLSDEDLAHSLASGGRLYELLSTLQTMMQEHPKLQDATCLALDPALIDTIDRMSRGYIVSTERPSPVSPALRLRDSWTSNKETIGEVGTGQALASSWLATLRTLASTSCVIALPAGSPDLDSLARTGNDALIREAFTSGANIIQDVVGVTPLENVTLSPSGYVSPTTMQLIYQALYTTDDANQPANTNYSDALTDAQPRSGSPTEMSDDITQAQTGTRSAIATSTTDDPHALRILVADTTEPFSVSAEHTLTTAGYNAGLAITVDQMGDSPMTSAFLDPLYRYDYRIDSSAARRATAEASIGVTLASNAHTLIVPPLLIDSTDAAAVVDALANNLESGAAQAMTLSSYLGTDAARMGESSATFAEALASGVDSLPSVYSDPAAITDTELLVTRQQITYIDDLTNLMVETPDIALTPYGFTRPLRVDLLRALTRLGRDSMSTYSAATESANDIFNGNKNMLLELRAAVSLIPPGTVYTRVSKRTPLYIVARNALPLPVITAISYAAVDPVQSSAVRSSDAAQISHTNAQATSEPIYLPAKGSITTQLNADVVSRVLSDDTTASSSTTGLTLQLTAPQGSAISQPVYVTVVTRTVSVVWPAVVIIIIFAAALIRRKFRTSTQHENRKQSKHSVQ